MIWIRLIAAYFVGSIPFGVMIAARAGIDIRAVGSGNTGATNVYRTLGAKCGYQVLALDILKGFLPALASSMIVKHKVGVFEPATFAIIVGTVAVIGHCFSIFLNFRGGKGIATLLGAALGATPVVAVPAFVMFGVLLATTRFMSLSTILGVWFGVAIAFVVPGIPVQVLPLFVLLGLFITIKHRANILRLINHTEPRFDLKNRSGASQTLSGQNEFNKQERESK